MSVYLTHKELLEQEYIHLYSEDIDTKLYDEVQEFTVILKSDGVKSRYISGDIDATVFQFPLTTERTYQSRGRLAHLLRFGGYVEEGLGVYDIRDYGLPYSSLYGINERGEKEILEYWLEFPLSRDYTTNDTSGNVEYDMLIGANRGFVGGQVLYPYNTYRGNFYGEFGENAPTFVSNIPIFDNEDDLNDYLTTGDYSKAINPSPSEPSEGEGKIYYYDYELDDINTTTHAITHRGENTFVSFRLLNSSDKVAFIRLADNMFELSCSNTKVLTFNRETLSYDTETPFSDIRIEIIKGIRGNKMGNIDTNIQFVDSFDELVDIEKNEYSYNGVDDEMSLTSISFTANFVNAYYVSSSELNNIATVLYANDESLQETLKKGLWMYSENPVDCVVDLCYYPFDLTPFISHHRTKKLKFGSFVYNGQVSSVSQTDYYGIDGTNTPFQLVNQRLMPVYNDFRDFNSVSYSLFLPYYGIIPIENTCIGKILKVVAYLDVFTAQLKYYIMIDGSIANELECSVGRHISVRGTNWITKSGNKVKDALSGVSGAVSAVSAAASLNPIGIIGGVTSMIDASMNYLSKPQTTITGSSSSGLNIFDPMSCYLIVEQYETVKPANLNSEYGRPTYVINKLISASGFTQISDIKLNSSATLEEQNEIINLLKDGVII